MSISDNESDKRIDYKEEFKEYRSLNGIKNTIDSFLTLTIYVFILVVLFRQGYDFFAYFIILLIILSLILGLKND